MLSVAEWSLEGILTCQREPGGEGFGWSLLVGSFDWSPSSTATDLVHYSPNYSLLSWREMKGREIKKRLRQTSLNWVVGREHLELPRNEQASLGFLLLFCYFYHFLHSKITEVFEHVKRRSLEGDSPLAILFKNLEPSKLFNRIFRLSLEESSMKTNFVFQTSNFRFRIPKG